MAFEQDIPQLTNASRNGWQVAALFDEADGDVQAVENLEIAYLDTEIDSDSRTLKFYVRLPNHVTHSAGSDGGTQFINWRYRPGQRLQLRLPVEIWQNQIVLPVDAVAREGAEYFVFQQNGNHFDRVPVHVKYRDQFSVVVANDGQLFPRDVVALRSAHQMQMALKNKAGGGVDPHAGHNH
jgi:multidrug efflux pump subunit AcrA (membrane-fusion protein)